MAETIQETTSIPKTARRLGISPQHCYTLAHRDELPVPVLKLGNRIVVPTAALDEVLAQRKEGNSNAQRA